MGMLVNGKWTDKWYETEANGGRFVRDESAFRNRIGRETAFPAEKDRYHLYVSLACPWAHRTLITRTLKGLEDVIRVSIVAPVWQEGWTFDPAQGGTKDHLYGAHYLHEFYTRAKPDYSGRVTVPTLWDRDAGTIVSNESADIIRMFNGTFDAWAKEPVDLYPKSLRDEIDSANEWVYRDVNNGVYRTGFASTQEAYEEAFDRLFSALDRLEERLSRQRYLAGDRLTEADIRLFTTLARFDPVYHGHFKCNRNRLVDFPSLWAYTRDLYQTPGFGDTTDFDHIKRHYYCSHPAINPNGIVPKGPAIDFAASHGRETF